MIVMKFGGTSVQDADAILRVRDIVVREQARKPLVVVSACAGVTNALLALAEAAGRRSADEAAASVHDLLLRHTAIAETLLPAERFRAVARILKDEATRLIDVVRSVATIGELTLRTRDAILSTGERWSSLLLHETLTQSGTRTELLDARQLLMTSERHAHAEPLLDDTTDRCRTLVTPLLEAGAICVTQGFIGATRNGVTTTIGRGGSDYSAALFGAVLDAVEIQIWTDVDGMMTADPRIIPDARVIPFLSFDEASDLAYFGAKVLHPSTLLPAIQKGIPVRIVNSLRPDGRGTSIHRRPRIAGPRVTSIAAKRGITSLTLKSKRSMASYGFLSAVFDIFERHSKRIDSTNISEVSLSLTIDDNTGLQEILAELERIADVQVEHGKAIICVTGRRLAQSGSITGQVFTILGRMHVRVDLITHGGSPHTLTFVVHEEDVEQTIRILHAAFFGPEEARPETRPETRIIDAAILLQRSDKAC